MAFDIDVKISITEMPVFCIGVSGFESALLPVLASFLLMHTLGSSNEIQIEFWPLAPAWSSPGYFGHLRSQPTNGKYYLPPSVSAF